jgi:DNA polymerase-3 subunit alpha
MKFNSDDYYLKSYEEMKELFPEDEEALANTIEIVDKCNFEFTYGKYMFPSYVPDNGDNPETYIRKLIDDGVKSKYGEYTDEIRERIESELQVIKKQGFIEYFLIVWDYIYNARKMGISVGPGRGSGAGSIVAFLIGITDIDPLKYDLYFERFLNSERVSAPDFDVDFEDCRRQEVIDYVKSRYGEDRFCKIVTFGTMAAKNAIKDVGRALDVSYATCDMITKAIPTKVTKKGKEVEIKRPNILQKVFGFYQPNDNELKDNLTSDNFAVPELVEMYNNDPEIKRVVDIAMRLEDTPRQSSTHACGAIIGHDILDRHMPLSRNGEDITSQFTGVELEHLGFLKMDFLGLRNLSDIKNCIEYVKENYGVDVDFSNRIYDDPKVYELISSGNTDAIFQLESGGFKRFLKDLKPSCLEDIIAAVSLYRPGPMDSIPRFVENKHHPENVTYHHPLLKPILEQTYGCIVYQEQVMKIVQELAGYTLGQADMVRRMMGKKKVEDMMREEAIFINGKPESVDKNGKVIKGIDGCIKRGVPEDVAKKIWSEMKDFAKYAFNKSHAAAYSVITYQTAYLKTYYEPEFITSFLNNRITDIEDIRKYTSYAKSEGIDVLPPDINFSNSLFTVKNKQIRYGMGAIKNIGLGLIESVVEERNKNGKFTSFEDFINRCAHLNLNKRMLENLILAGAFDSFGKHRSQLLAVYSDFLDRVVSQEKNKNAAQISMFDTLLKDDDALKIDYPDIPEFSSKEKFMKEKSVCGICLTGNPLEDYKKYFDNFNFTTKRLEAYEEQESEHEDEGTKRVYTDITDGEHVTMGAIISDCKKLSTKSGSNMAFVMVEDLYGQIEVIVFPKVYENAKSVLNNEEVVKVSGKIQIKDGIPQIIADNVEKIEINKDQEIDLSKEYLGLIFTKNDKQKIDVVLDVCENYPGDIDVIVAIEGKKYSANLSVRKCEGFVSELKNYLSSDEIIFFKKK